MTKPNDKFNLDVSDVDHIEKALRYYQSVVDSSQRRNITEVLGKLHQQKNWYRPKNETYVSG